MERTLVLVKPDGVRRGLVGEVIRRIETKGYTLARLELRTPTRELLAEHYAEHQGKPFYEPLVEFMSSGPVVAMVVEGQHVVEAFRTLAGATDPTKAAPGHHPRRPRPRLGHLGAAEPRPRLRRRRVRRPRDRHLVPGALTGPSGLIPPPTPAPPPRRACGA